MTDWHVPLVIVTLVFGAFLVYRFRPVLATTRGGAAGRAARAALRAAKERASRAKSDGERAAALCDAGDGASAGGRTNAAIGYYLRSMRLAPSSVELVERAAKGLVHRPHALESLLWRRLSARPWEGADAAAAHAALRALSELYATRALRHPTRARALAHALAALGAAPPAPSPSSTPSSDALPSEP